MAAATMSSVLGSRAVLIKPFSAKPSQRRVIIRAGDPAAPDPSQVDGEVRQCESLSALCLRCLLRFVRECSDGSPSGVKAITRDQSVTQSGHP